MIISHDSLISIITFIDDLITKMVYSFTFYPQIISIMPRAMLYVFFDNAGIGFLISLCLAGFGLDSTKIQIDRIHTITNTEGLLTSYLRLK